MVSMVTDADILSAYKVLLGRDVDAGGLAHYRRLAREGMNHAFLRADIMNSEEFRNLAGVFGQRIVDMGDAFVVVDPHEPEFGRHIAAHRSWEPHIMAIVKRHLKQGDTFIDVGANIGVMAFAAASVVGPTGRVLAFEPHPDNIRNFLAGVARNGFGHVTLYGFALSDRQSIFSLIGSSNGYLMPTGQTPFQTVSLRGDDLIADQPRIDFIKMDIEGHEPQALAGLERTLSKHRPMVLCEFNPRCLQEHIGCPPYKFAEQLFALTDRVDAIEHDGFAHSLDSPGALLDLWARKNLDAVTTGMLPDGMLHFDLLFKIVR